MNSTRLFVDVIVDNYPILQYFSVNNFSLFNMIWNLFLMVVPFFVCLALIKYRKRNNLLKIYQKITAVFLFVVWVLFIPNTAYIITDARHMLADCDLGRYKVCAEFAWTIIFFFFFGVIGWIAFVLLINQMKLFIKEVFGARISGYFSLIIIPIISLGVLMGLVQRWNTWEFLLSPFNVIGGALEFFINGIYFLNWLIFSILMFILYYIGDKLFADNVVFVNKLPSLACRIKLWFNNAVSRNKCTKL